jgi:hypothetical protein
MVDFTDQLVLDNLICSLADEEIKRKILAMPEKDCTLDRVLRFVEAEEMGKNSIVEGKMFESVNGMSGYRKQQKQQFDNRRQEGAGNGGRTGCAPRAREGGTTGSVTAPSGRPGVITTTARARGTSSALTALPRIINVNIVDALDTTRLSTGHPRSTPVSTKLCQ